LIDPFRETRTGDSPGAGAKPITVDMGDLRVTDDPEAQLVTYALGSCIAVIVHDPVRRYGGMLHFMLPLSQINPTKARERPGMFGDLGVPLLFEQMYRLGSRKQDLVVKVAGGGQINDSSGIFEIGKRNYTVLRKMFWRAGVPIAAEDCGGSRSRTARLFVATGKVTIRSMGKEHEL
jgi:chemotaxis protein CheD